MTRRDTVLVHHREAIRSAAASRGGRIIALTGSVARGEDTSSSDYDFLVDFRRGHRGLLNLAGLQVELERLLGSDVDVVPVSCLRDHCQGMIDDAIVL